ncbi:hypothetical protein BDZ85DRAFT_259557 [Elsinoe ampelina]|uniref:Uncharacterized protein n=1 Tax=Elsinoe ampelina TaxID=302913 RepID=A0A6A6GHE4_9PEZI|nr:hypothetical protein BDZ85DRAFT_259557 [Elsinoe ampelina]
MSLRYFQMQLLPCVRDAMSHLAFTASKPQTAPDRYPAYPRPSKHANTVKRYISRTFPLPCFSFVLNGSSRTRLLCLHLQHFFDSLQRFPPPPMRFQSLIFAIATICLVLFIPFA